MDRPVGQPPEITGLRQPHADLVQQAVIKLRDDIHCPEFIQFRVGPIIPRLRHASGVSPGSILPPGDSHFPVRLSIDTKPLTRMKISANVHCSTYRTIIHPPKESVTVKVIVYLLCLASLAYRTYLILYSRMLDWYFASASDQTQRLFGIIGIIFGTVIITRL